MRIVMFGDSITDMAHSGEIGSVHSYGAGYPFVVYSKLCESAPLQHEIINKGISGNRIVDLYARIKSDVWNLTPDVVSILIGVNDIWHELGHQNGVDLARYERMYRMIIEETKERLPNIQFMLLEPFVLQGKVLEVMGAENFAIIREYAKVVKKLAEEYGLVFVPLQEKFEEMSKKHGAEFYLYDGVHPAVGGAVLIANEWLKGFEKIDR